MSSLIPLPTPELMGTYDVRLLDHDGTTVHVLENYTELEYTIAVNGMGHHGWGSYQIVGDSDLMYHQDWFLDRIMNVRRRPAGGSTFYSEFDGIHRYKERYLDQENRMMFLSTGFDLRSLLKRRRILPATGDAFVRDNDHFTDIMRELVRTQAAAGDARQITYLTVEADSHEGDEVDLVYRYDRLHEALEEISGLGADFDIERVGSNYTFRVYYPYNGSDHRVGNPYGNPEVLFSIGNGNMGTPRLADDRLEEITTVFVLGEGVGADREILQRYSLYDAQLDSPWNLIEDLLEASKEVTLGALAAQGDAYLIDMMRKINLEFEYIPTEACLYETHWNVGDLVSAEFEGNYYNMRVVEVTVSVTREGGEKVVPTMLLLPTWMEDWDIVT